MTVPGSSHLIVGTFFQTPMTYKSGSMLTQTRPWLLKRGLEPICVHLRDTQVEFADFDDISPFLAEIITVRLRPIVPISEFSFWKLKEPRSPISEFQVGILLEDVAEKLAPSTPVSPYAFNIVQSIELVLQTGGKHTLEEPAGDVVDFVKRIQIEPPIVLAQARNFITSRQRVERFFIDHRRVHGAELPDWVNDLPPMSLQYKGFGHFFDVFCGCRDVPGFDRISPSRIWSAVDDFANRMRMVGVDENTRMRDGIDTLNNILSARIDNLSLRLSRAPVNSNASYILGPHRAAICGVQFENATGNTIPYVEMMGHFIHSTRDSLQYDESVMRGWKIPCLGLTIIGHYVTFYAMIHLREWRVVSLTPGLSCFLDACGGNDRNALYNAFMAASVLLAHIEEEAGQLVAIPRPPIQESRYLPYISTLAHPSGSSIDFQLLVQCPSIDPDQCIYVAEATDGMIIIKFTQWYSYELHTFCADRGLAPKLLGFERLPGGIFCVAMDDFRSALQITKCLSDPTKVTRWADQLRELVAAFHTQGLVHGGLRSPNIRCDGNKVMVVDFDSAGREGEAYYPFGPLNIELTEGREGTNLKITKADDLRILCNTLKQMGLECDRCRPKSGRSPAV